MFPDNNTFYGSGWDQYLPFPIVNYHPNNQRCQFAQFSSSFVDVTRDTRPINLSYPPVQYPTASSIRRTATSGASVRMPPKRNSDASPSGTPAKLPKTDLKPEDFSNSVKKRLQSSTRTGQACDRCKIRKIRCDGLPGGCSPCLQNQTECRTTDRITGRAAPRGYVDNIEAQNRDMASRIRELENLLMQNGIDVKPANTYHDPNVPPYNFNPPAPNGMTAWNPPPPANAYTPGASNGAIVPPPQETNLFRAIPPLRAGISGDHFLGVSCGNSHLSSIKGTALSILGMEIDIADFASVDMDEPDSSVFHPQLYNKSYQAFLQSTLNVNPRIEKVDLPPREDGLTYAEWYFRVLNPYLPILHKPTFMKILTRMYDDPNFRPTVAQSVMVHMVFAIMFFQYAFRNWEDATQQATLNHQSNLHYHYSLGMFYQLSCSHTIEDAQALTLICAHLRNFPKPGASWILTNTTLALAIELGMHRSAKHRPADVVPDLLEVEMRKRTFWSIMAIHVTLSGKLGRPMAIRLEDIDVEFPEPIDDELLSENGLDTSRPGKCGHVIGIVAFSLLPLFIELYSTIYAVRRRPEAYVDTVNSLEAKLHQWTTEIPGDLARGEGGTDVQEGRIFALMSQAWVCEFRMLLHHPSTSMTMDRAFNAEGMRICVESARKMLAVVSKLQEYKSLDTTWYNSAVYVMAVTTTLFAQWEKRSEITAADLSELRSEMDAWLSIMGDVGALLGSGTRLREAVRTVTDGTLTLLSHSLTNKPGKFCTPTTNSQDIKPRQKSISNGTGNSNNFNGNSYSPSFGNDPVTTGTTSSSTYLASDSQISHQSTPYPAATQYSSYPDPPSSSNALSYPPNDTHTFTSYTSNTTDSVEAPLLAAFANQASQVAQQTNWQRPPSQNGNGIQSYGSQSWQQWTSTMAGNLEPQECYSASALMQLGGRDLGVDGNGVSNVDMSSQTAVMPISGHIGGETMGGGGVTWPLNIFDIGSGSTV